MMNELKFNAEISKYKRVSICIITAYKWGEGWSNSESTAFDAEMNNVFTAAGYTVVPGKHYGCCASLKKEGFNEELDIYMHPMEFSGLATQEEIDEIVSILESCKTVEGVWKIDAKEVYEVNNNTCETILAENSHEIIEWAKDYKANHKKRYRKTIDNNEIAFAFAEKFRPMFKCFYNCYGRSYGDIDIKFVRNLLIVAEKNGLM